MIIRVRRGLEVNRLSYTPQLGEPTFTTDEKKLYIGDGSTPGGILVDMNGAGLAPVQSVAGRDGDVVLFKSDVGLSDVDNTADVNKPVSTATQTALDAKATVVALNSHEADTLNPHNVTKAQIGLPDVDNVSAANLRDRSTHTGTQPTSSVAGLDLALAGKQPAGSYATTIQLADGLDDKADLVHTHPQSDVIGLTSALTGKQAVLVSGTNIKTINGATVLGAGDLVIPSGDDEVITFETVSKNIKAWGATFNYTGDQLTSISYTDGVDVIIKTLNYTGEKLTTLVLSGDTPAGIDLTKTLAYTGDQLTGASYS